MSPVRAPTRAIGRAPALALAFTGAFVLALFALVARELFAPRRAVASVSHPSAAAESPPPPALSPSPPSPIAHAAPLPAPAHAPSPPDPSPPTPSPASPPSPAAALALAAAVSNPRSTAPVNVVQNARNHSETYSYDRLPPFAAADLTRAKANPKAWDMNLVMGPTLDQLAPRSGVREAVVQKDEHGDPFATWYAIESGPLAPAYAMKQGERTRVISRAYLEANRADFPPSVTAVLDR